MPAFLIIFLISMRLNFKKSCIIMYALSASYQGFTKVELVVAVKNHDH